TGVVATAAALSLGLAACSGDSGEGGDGDNGDNGANKSEPISIGIASGWPEGEAASYMWRVMPANPGRTVEMETAETGTTCPSLAGEGGDDLLFDAWLPATHADYVDKYGDDIQDLGVWYDQATLNIAVNDDAPIDSLSELADNADAFGNRLVGIDPGAGLTK